MEDIQSDIRLLAGKRHVSLTQSDMFDSVLLPCVGCEQNICLPARFRCKYHMALRLRNAEASDR